MKNLYKIGTRSGSSAGILEWMKIIHAINPDSAPTESDYSQG